jgi:hypothetical protein
MIRNLIFGHVSQVFHNVHFRHFGKLKLRILLNPKLIIWLCVVHIFGYIGFGIRKFYEAHFFPIYYCLKSLFLKNVLIFIFTVCSVYPMLFPHNMFSSDLLHDECLS